MRASIFTPATFDVRMASMGTVLRATLHLLDWERKISESLFLWFWKMRMEKFYSRDKLFYHIWYMWSKTLFSVFVSRKQKPFFFFHSCHFRQDIQFSWSHFLFKWFHFLFMLIIFTFSVYVITFSVYVIAFSVYVNNFHIFCLC